MAAFGQGAKMAFQSVSKKRYVAFLSYSHVDRKAARLLHRRRFRSEPTPASG
jgi:hypothetical protein